MATLTPRVVLVTGVSRYLGGRLARELCEYPSIERVIGVDTLPPVPSTRPESQRIEFVRADIRNPLIGKVISSAGVDTVVHLNINAARKSASSATKELNVIGTMQLLAACQKADSVRRLIVKSTTAVYGTSPRDPGLFTEDTDARAIPSFGYARDALEIEGYVRGFARRRPDVGLSVLRFTNFIGPNIDSTLARYFSQPVVTTILGSDARLQLVHEEDAIAVLRRAALHDLPGVVNVGGDGVVLLSQAIRRAGRLGIPVPSSAVQLIGRAFRRFGLPEVSPEQVRFLNFGRVVDTTRLKTVFGYTPRYSTLAAFDDYVLGRRLRPVISPATVGSVEQVALGVAARLPGARGAHQHGARGAHQHGARGARV